MESNLGWIELSPSALRRLRQDLEPDSEGVRDEMGLMALHSGYADRFFPGSSVQHRRPRYLFFTCWNYLCLQDGGGVSALVPKEAEEDWVKRRLMAAGETQPPDTIYWAALSRWGFYRGPSRATLIARWDSIVKRRVRVRAVRDDSVELLGHVAEFNVPEPPHYWLHPKPREPVTFALTRLEALFLQERQEALDHCIPRGGRDAREAAGEKTATSRRGSPGGYVRPAGSSHGLVTRGVAAPPAPASWQLGKQVRREQRSSI